MVGDSIGSPSTTLPIAATMSAGGVSLSRKPWAPAASARDDVLVGVEGRQHDDLGGSGSVEHGRGRGDAVHDRHADVHQHDVDAAGAHRLDRLGAVDGLADDRDVGRPAEDQRRARRGRARRRRQQHPSSVMPATVATPTGRTRARASRGESAARRPSAVRSASPIRPSPDSGFGGQSSMPTGSGLRTSTRQPVVRPAAED